MAIPKKIHFVFGLRKDEGGRAFGYFHYLNILSAVRVNTDYEINFYYLYRPSSKWFDKLTEEKINFIQLDHVEDEFNGIKISNYAHKADYLRLDILRKHGGIYLDTDVICVRPFDDFLKFKCVLGYESVNNITWGLPNFTILSEPNNPFINLWYERYSEDYHPDDWAYGAVKLPYLLYQENLDLVTTVSSEFFSLYGWDDASKYHMFKNVGMINPAYSIHLWESRWWDELKIIDEDYLNKIENTISNLYLKYSLGYKDIKFNEYWS